MQKQPSIFHGALLLTGAGFFFRLVSMLFQAYLARTVGASGVGLLQLIGAVGVFSMTLGTSGVRVAAMYLSAEEYGHRRLGGIRSAMSHCIVYGMIVSTITGTALCLSAQWLALRWVKDLRAASSLRIMGLFLPFNCLCAVMSGYYTACSRIRKLVVIEIAERIVSLLFTAALLQTWASGDLERACCAVTLGSSVGCVFDFFLLYASYRKDCRHYGPIPPNLSMGRRLIRLCVPLALNDILRSGLSTCEQFLIPWGLSGAGGGRESAMADYGTIHGMVFPVMMFPAAILYSVADVLVPELSRNRAIGRQVRIQDLADKCLSMGLVFSVLVSGSLAVLSRPLGRLLYRSDAAGAYLRLFAPLVLILYMDAMVDGMHKGLGQQLYCVRYNTITNVMDVVLLFLLLPRYGISGYYFTFAFTHIINFYLSIARLIKVADCTVRPGFLLRALLSGALSVACTCLLPDCADLPGLVLRGLAFCAASFVFFTVFQVVSQSDRAWLCALLRHSQSKSREASARKP